MSTDTRTKPSPRLPRHPQATPRPSPGTTSSNTWTPSRCQQSHAPVATPAILNRPGSPNVLPNFANSYTSTASDHAYVDGHRLPRHHQTPNRNDRSSSAYHAATACFYLTSSRTTTARRGRSRTPPSKRAGGFSGVASGIRQMLCRRGARCISGGSMSGRDV